MTASTHARTDMKWRDGYFIGFMFIPLVPMVPWLILTGQSAPSLGLLSPIRIYPIEILTPDIRVGELANRISALSASALVVFLAASVGLLSLYSTWKAAAESRYRLVIMGVWLTVVAILEGAIIRSTNNVFNLFGQGFFQDTLGQIDSLHLTTLFDCQFVITTGVVVFGATGLSATATWIAMEAATLQTADDVAQFNTLSRRLDLVLYASAAILVAGIIDVKQWSLWPSPLVSGKGSADGNFGAYTNLVNAVVAFQSVCYVGVLIGIFLPAAACLDRARARMVLANAQLGDSASRFDHLVHVLAVLAPVLVGPVATFVGLKLGG
jgi:hypothetical protein